MFVGLTNKNIGWFIILLQFTYLIDLINIVKYFLFYIVSLSLSTLLRCYLKIYPFPFCNFCSVTLILLKMG